ncbi:MAG TPA: RNA polymerase sigma factor RpoD/SigA [Chitinophagaceae bacterium]|nr:RNA polymerase sigma factor RpoD/SigA [Chitinophagaceae bacterium]
MSMRQLKITNSITNRESESIDKYFLEINKIPLITVAEEVRLAILIKNGDEAALNSLVKANLRFVVSVAKQYQHQGTSLADLINEGNIGLMKAARSFDASRGFKFISYAVWWIRQQIILALVEQSRLIRMPLNKVALKGRIQKAGSLLEQKLERTASVEELAEELNMNTEDIADSLRMSERSQSLDSPLSEDGEESLLNMLENSNAESADKEMCYTGSLKVEIDRSLQSLNERQKETICWFFGIGIDQPMSLDDIAMKLMVTPERVRQIKDKAIEKLRTNGNVRLLQNYLAA